MVAHLGGGDGPCPLCVEQLHSAGPPDELVITLVAIGEPELGLWCPECVLPSGVRVQLGTECVHGWLTGRAGVATWCTDCSRPLRVE